MISNRHHWRTVALAVVTLAGPMRTRGPSYGGGTNVAGLNLFGSSDASIGGTVIDVSGAYDGIGAGDYNTVTGRAVLRMPLN